MMTPSGAPGCSTSSIWKWAVQPWLLWANVRGDAPEGIRVAFQLMEALRSVESGLKGYVDVYPCINPLAAEQGRRLVRF